MSYPALETDSGLCVNCQSARKFWLVFLFLDNKDRTFILHYLWPILNGYLVHSYWYADFSPTREWVIKRHLWVFLLGLPFPLQNCSLLEDIGNTIGRFVAIEEDFMNTYDKRMAKILVEMDISKGMPADVEILCLERLFSQRLVYLSIPFRCVSFSSYKLA